MELECKAKVKDLISKLMGIAERAGRKPPDPSKTDDESLIILLNGRNIHSLKGLETELKEGGNPNIHANASWRVKTRL